jgi:hypothetical protein
MFLYDASGFIYGTFYANFRLKQFMDKDRVWHPQPMDPDIMGRVKAELNELDRELVDVDGKQLKPSQCYHFDVSPLHVLFNTNCPDSLKQKVQAILSKYIPHETRTQQ